MRIWAALAIVWVSACTDSDPGSGSSSGGKEDDPNVSFTGVATDWEYTVGHAGDAVVREVRTLAGGRVLATSHFPKWIAAVTATSGLTDRRFGEQTSDVGPERSGWLDVPAHDVWEVGANQLVVAAGEGQLFDLRGYRADGSINDAFGNAGVIALPAEWSYSAQTLTVIHDAANARFLALVLREWEHPQYGVGGPSKIEVLAFDEMSGAQTSAGLFELPAWGYVDTTPPTLHELVARPDGSFLVLVSETVHTPNPLRASVATQWSILHLAPGQAAAKTTLAVTEYGADIAGFARLDGGRFDLYVTGLFDDLSTTADDRKLVRISIDDALTPELDVVGPGIDLRAGCVAAVATPTALLYGQSSDRSKPIELTEFPKAGAPIHFTSDQPKRCLVSLSMSGGHIYAGTWNTTNSDWTALLTSFVPR